MWLSSMRCAMSAGFPHGWPSLAGSKGCKVLSKACPILSLIKSSSKKTFGFFRSDPILSLIKSSRKKTFGFFPTRRTCTISTVRGELQCGEPYDGKLSRTVRRVVYCTATARQYTNPYYIENRYIENRYVILNYYSKLLF